MAKKPPYDTFHGFGPTQVFAKNMAVLEAEKNGYTDGGCGVFWTEEGSGIWEYSAHFTYRPIVKDKR